MDCFGANNRLEAILMGRGGPESCRKILKKELPAEVLDATLKCDKAFSCLEAERTDLCPVQSCIAGEVHFIKCLNEDPCAYQVAFGEGHVCNCPARKEIYNRYGI